MAIGVIILSYNQRQKINIVFCVLNGIQIFFAILIIMNAIYIYFGIAPSLYTERVEVSFLFIVLLLFGLQVVFYYLLGMKISYKCMNHTHKKSTRGLLLLWVCAGFFLMVNLIILASMSTAMGNHVGKSMKYSFLYGMQHYLLNEKWKQVIDTFQYEFSCCGLESYEDWHDLSWLTKHHINEDTDLAKKFLNPESKTYRVEPWSCCKLDFPMQCLHDPLQQVHSTQIWDNEPQVVEDSVNTVGCLDIIQKSIFSALNIFIIIVALLIFVNFVIFILSRYLYTSCRNALILNDPEGPAPGWIFGRGDCGYTRGKSIYDIMSTKENYKFKDLKPKGKRKKKSKKPDDSYDNYSDTAASLSETKYCECAGLDHELICECPSEDNTDLDSKLGEIP